MKTICILHGCNLEYDFIENIHSCPKCKAICDDPATFEELEAETRKDDYVIDIEAFNRA